MKKGQKIRQRGKRKNKICYKKEIRFLGVNAAGIRSKLTSFKNTLNNLKPAVFYIEETKMKDEGKLKLENYDIFELTRKSRDGGGGLAIGCIKELQATWVREGDDTVESLSVDIFLRNKKIRCCIAYGCQESDNLERKEAFWNYLSEEVSIADQEDSGFILHCDGNLWAGENIIPGDPRKQNKNGKLFQTFLEENPNLTVVNSLSLCQGLITRRRAKNEKIEESVIDFFVVCNRVLPFVKKMIIDEEKKYILTNYEKVKKGGRAINSDHFTQFMDLELEIGEVKPERVEIYDIKKKTNLEKFRHLTSESSELSKCFETNAPLYAQIENWRTLLRSFCNQAFPKIKLKKKMKIHVNKEISNLISRRSEIALKIQNEENCYECSFDDASVNEVKKHIKEKHVIDVDQNCRQCTYDFTTVSGIRKHIQSEHSSKEKIKCKICGKTLTGKSQYDIHLIEHNISSLEAQENRRKILENFQSYSDNPENINMGEMWKLIKKIWPKYNSKSTAKRNHVGKIISNPQEIKKLLSKEYKERLRERPIRPDLKMLLGKRKFIFEKKLELAQSKESAEWTMQNLDLALSKLKTKKSRDFEGYANEMFKDGVIGSD